MLITFLSTMAAAQLTPSLPRIAVDEQLSYAIKWGIVHAGTSSLSVQGVEDVAGQPAYHIVSEARSAAVIDAFYKVRDRNESWMDTRQPRSLKYARNIREGSYRIKEVITLDQEKRRFSEVSERLDKNRRETTEGDITPNVLDVLSSLYYVRTLPLEVGKEFVIDVHSSDKVWPLVLKVKGRETVRVHAGKFDCYRVEPVLREAGIFIAKGKKLEVWITADEKRLPVLMRAEIFIGHVAAELVNAKVSKEPASVISFNATFPSKSIVN